MSTSALKLIEARVAAETDQVIDVDYVTRSTSITVDGNRYKRCFTKQSYGLTQVRFEVQGSRVMQSFTFWFKQDDNGKLVRYSINARVGTSIVGHIYDADQLLRKQFIQRCVEAVKAARLKHKQGGNEANARVSSEYHATIEYIYEMLPDPFIIHGWSLYCHSRLVTHANVKIIEIYDADHPDIVVFRIRTHGSSVIVTYHACRSNERFARSSETTISAAGISVADIDKAMIKLMKKFNAEEHDRMFGRA